MLKPVRDEVVEVLRLTAGNLSNTAVEVHNGLTGLIAEKTVVNSEGEPLQFDAMWISSLCYSTSKGNPDIEIVDLTSRLRTVEEIMEVTTKPIIFDDDTGRLKEHFVYTVKTLERVGVSMIIIEDKIDLKKNSLFGTEVTQTQDDVARALKALSLNAAWTTPLRGCRGGLPLGDRQSSLRLHAK